DPQPQQSFAHVNSHVFGADDPQVRSFTLLPVGTGVIRSTQRSRQHGAVLQPPERRDLERAGWRTTLDYRENHVRSVDGRLLRIEPVWVAVAERYDLHVSVASAEGSTGDEGGQHPLDEIDEARITTSYRVRVAGR